MTHRYYIIYKPYLVLSKFSAHEGERTLGEIYPDLPKDVYPVGRLDNDSEGLLILTNDTKLNHRLLDPEFGHEREYWVQVDGAFTLEASKALESGVSISIDGQSYYTKPAKCVLFENNPILPPRVPPIRFRKNIPAPWISLTLTEGKNRQVRKMTAVVGFPTLRLVRYRIGEITIKAMQPGKIIELPQQTIYKKLFKDSL